uniref:2-oxoisovalerate dehydrogenase E2 component (Dihydrolipoyl transacylase) (BkdB) n=1 Tax=uncultured marine group II/III euryarchaeote SAT1000_33_E05 TaxID=1456575 RepID=A0A075ICM3_9EURY|nr:2-oxoisovalerate dehydrogenase E2 component (dihydrolipoyl transacylase) (bkdB) [uncultured marine group II/III euryarchaeote SAT1000_33_E05]
MGKHVFKLPDIGEGVVEGEVVQWHVAAGDEVTEDDPIVDVMTDKATVTIPSPITGVVSSLSGDVGEMVAVGSALVEFDSDAAAVSISEPGPSVESEAEPEPSSEPEPAPAPEPVPLAPEPSAAPVASSGKVLASPAIRRRAREAGVDLSQVRGSGPAGRVRHADLDAYIAADGAVSGAAPSAYLTKRTGVTEVKVVGLRRKIAEQMTISKRTIPHFSYFEEADVTELETLRQMLNASRDESQPKLTYLPFIMLALSKIMPDHPECNAHYDDQGGVVSRHDAVHIGIATQTERGLYVPVVKHVEAMDAWQAAAELQRVAGAARGGTASLDDLTGSTFTITSLGRDGGLGATPIINHPEVAILGIHKARDMPVAKDGQVVVRRIMNLSSSFDHRVVDGADGAALVQHLRRMLEHPALIFM